MHDSSHIDKECNRVQLEAWKVKVSLEKIEVNEKTYKLTNTFSITRTLSDKIRALKLHNYDTEPKV